MSDKANDRAPTHYVKEGSQHWDRMWSIYREAWFVGNITKYTERYRKKEGIKDLLKAKHYIEKLIELEEDELMKEAAKDHMAAREKALEESDRLPIHFLIPATLGGVPLPNNKGSTRCGMQGEMILPSLLTREESKTTCRVCLNNLKHDGYEEIEHHPSWIRAAEKMVNKTLTIPEADEMLKDPEVLKMAREVYDRMTPDRYVKLAMRTKCDQQAAIKRITGQEITQDRSLYLPNVQLLHAVTGINAEGGELATALQKWIWYGQISENFKEELGDLMWYIAEACDAMDFSLQDVMESNIRKLKARYPEKFSEEKAANRDVEAERAAMRELVPGLTEKFKTPQRVDAETLSTTTQQSITKAAVDNMEWYGVTKCECCDQLATRQVTDGSPDSSNNVAHFFCTKHDRPAAILKPKRST